MIKMVMIFQSNKALKHLMEKGYVFTFRIFKNYNRKLGRNWITDKRGGKKIADVIICNATDYLIKPIPIHLKDFVFASGFNTTTEWIEEIKRINIPTKEEKEYGLLGEIFCVVKV